MEETKGQKPQLQVDIDTIVGYLQCIPEITALDIQEPEGDDMWEKKVYITFNGSNEPVVIELF